jgi:hypothetical protein
MTISTNHTLAIVGPNKTQIRAKVTYVQPASERWHPDHAPVHISTHEWLDPYRYPATYNTGSPLGEASVAGSYTVHSYMLEGGEYLYVCAYHFCRSKYSSTSRSARLRSQP